MKTVPRLTQVPFRFSDRFMLDGTCFRPVQEGDLEDVCALEAESYPVDEAAAPETLRFRASVAPELFWILRRESDGALLGFTCATAACRNIQNLEHSTMATHVADGSVVCMHSVVVNPAYRRKGIGSAIVSGYVDQLRRTGRYDAVFLLAKKHIIGFYQEAAGFTCVGQSSVQHGEDVWYELQLRLR